MFYEVWHKCEIEYPNKRTLIEVISGWYSNPEVQSQGSTIGIFGLQSDI